MSGVNYKVTVRGAPRQLCTSFMINFMVDYLCWTVPVDTVDDVRTTGCRTGTDWFECIELREECCLHRHVQ